MCDISDLNTLLVLEGVVTSSQADSAQIRSKALRDESGDEGLPAYIGASVLTHYAVTPLWLCSVSAFHTLARKQEFSDVVNRKPLKANHSGEAEGALQWRWGWWWGRWWWFLLTAFSRLQQFVPGKTENCWVRWSLFISLCPIYCPFWVWAAQINPFITRAAWNSLLLPPLLVMEPSVGWLRRE